VAAVVVGGIAALIVIIVAIVIFVHNRRLRHRYNLLEQSVLGKSVELEPVEDLQR
jgi:hypothetical protein